MISELNHQELVQKLFSDSDKNDKKRRKSTFTLDDDIVHMFIVQKYNETRCPEIKKSIECFCRLINSVNHYNTKAHLTVIMLKDFENVQQMKKKH